MARPGAAIKTVWRWSTLYCRGAPVGVPTPTLLSRRRGTAPVTSRALRGAFWHVSAGRCLLARDARMPGSSLPCLRKRFKSFSLFAPAVRRSTPDPRKTHNQAQTVERNARRVTGSQPAFPSPRRRRFPSWFPPELRNATQRLIRERRSATRVAREGGAGATQAAVVSASAPD